MKKKPDDEFLSGSGDHEDRIHQALVEMGLIIPQTAEEVRIAEEAIGDAVCRPLPAGLADPSLLFHMLDELGGAVCDPLDGILAAGKRRGLSSQALASATNLSVVLITMFDRGMIATKGLPRTVVERIGEAVGSTAERVLEYLQAGPRFAVDTNFRADDAPELEEPQSFREAVLDDPTLTAEQRDRLLALADDVG